MKSLFPILGLVALALAFVVSLGIDFSHTIQGGAGDFRNRITGARLLEHGIDPYHFIWHPGDPTEFCDLRNNPRMTVSKTTVTPALMAMPVMWCFYALPRVPVSVLYVPQVLFVLGAMLCVIGSRTRESETKEP